MSGGAVSGVENRGWEPPAVKKTSKKIKKQLRVPGVVLICSSASEKQRLTKPSGSQK
jgi:hypothetical protein